MNWKELVQDRAGKLSSKRVVGLTGFTTTLLTYLLDGLHWYDVNEVLYQALLYASAGMLAAGVVEKSDNANKQKQ
jgi:hypothetical protein